MKLLQIVALAIGLSVLLTACPDQTNPAPNPDLTITAITASANTTTLNSAATSSLSATVSGTGAFDPGVNWSVISGGGTLSANTGSSVTYTAPTVTADTSVQIKAEAAGNYNVFKTLQLTVKSSTTPPVNTFSFTVDPSIQPSPSTTDDGRGGTLPLAVSRDEAGVKSTFIANEALIVPKNKAELDGFLARTGGTVIENNTIPVPPPGLGITLSDEERKPTTYTVRLNASAFPLERFEIDSASAGRSGKLTVSSNLAARLMALTVSEVTAGRSVGLNYLSSQDSVMLKTEESPNGAGFADAFATSRFQPSGSKSNVLGAWQWMKAKGMVRRVRLAILDGGFWVNGNGQPNSVPGIGTDLPPNPIQYDFVNDDYIVGGTNPGTCTGGATCRWHGNEAAGAALGLVNNRAGAAGTGGMVADAMLLHIKTTKAQQKWALSTARAWGADVISMSFGGGCNYWCRREEDIIGYDRELERASFAGIVIVASAGNDGQNVDEEYVHPCTYDGVICVGALNNDTNTPQGYSNYGGSVDIWGPTNIPVMPDPDKMTVHNYGGTSASAPFIAGIAAMMKAINPSLNSDQVRDIMRDTAWKDSGDSKVSHYINALEAVKRASNYELPADRFEPNPPNSPALLGAGQYDDLSIDKSAQSDSYRITVSGASKLTLNVTSPDNLGKLSYGLSKDAGCGWHEELENKLSDDKNNRKLVYRVPSGVYSLGLSSSQPLPYDLSVKLEGAPIVQDRYEPNNSLAKASNLSDGRSLNATLYAGDEDFYSFYSAGSALPQPGATNGYESLIQVMSADNPITLKLYDAAGNLVATKTSSPDCKTLAKFGNLAAGIWRFSVSSAAPGNYALFVGRRFVLGKFLNSVDALWGLIINPGDPIEFSVRNPIEWVALNFNQDGVPNALDLATSGLHLTLFDANSQQVSTGAASELQGVFGETLDLRQTRNGTQYYLRLERTASSEVDVSGSQLPVITAKLTLR